MATISIVELHVQSVASYYSRVAAIEDASFLVMDGHDSLFQGGS